MTTHSLYKSGIALIVCLLFSLHAHAADEAVNENKDNAEKIKINVSPEVGLYSKNDKLFFTSKLNIIPKDLKFSFGAIFKYGFSQDPPPAAIINQEISNWRVGLSISYDFLSVPPPSDDLVIDGTKKLKHHEKMEKSLILQAEGDYGYNKVSYYKSYASSKATEVKEHSFSVALELIYYYFNINCYPQIQLKYNQGYKEGDKTSIVIPGVGGNPDTVKTEIFEAPHETRSFNIRFFTPCMLGTLPLSLGPVLSYAATEEKEIWKHEAQIELWLRYYPGEIASIGVSPYVHVNFSEIDKTPDVGILIRIFFGKTYEY